MVTGITLTQGPNMGSFGKIDVRDSTVFDFDEGGPPIGIYGFSGDT